MHAEFQRTSFYYKSLLTGNGISIIHVEQWLIEE